ncbi:MAG: hypothetical protein ACT4OM_12985 [Actinomycetota bacterium]
MPPPIVALHGGDEFTSGAVLTQELLRPFEGVLLAPLAAPEEAWADLKLLVEDCLGRKVTLGVPGAGPRGSHEAVLIPGGDPALAATRVCEQLRRALACRSIVAASAGAMMLGKLMASGCPDHCCTPALRPGLGLVGGVVTPHFESLPAGYLAQLSRLVEDLPWHRICSNQVVIV